MNDHLKTVVSEHPLVLIDFYADWCEPCKWVEPILNDVISHFKGSIVLRKINIDDHPDTAREIHVLSVPTVTLFKDGEEIWRIRGFDTLPRMVKAIEEKMQTA